VSPDLAAYVCYGFVLLLGVVVAVGQVRKRLGGMEGIWYVPHTWILFAAYAAVPVVLFWFLDRTGAINDTSLFAAILIGVGYERIISGGNQALRAPGEVSALWTPFVAYADKVSRIVLERGARDQLRLAEKIITEIVGNEVRYRNLEALALARSSNIDEVRARLAEIDAVTGSGLADRQEKKTRYLYGVLLAVPDIHQLLRSKSIISSNFYLRHVKRLPQLAVASTAAIVLVALSAALLWLRYPDYREIAGSYHVWRLGKANNTSIDQYRSRRELVLLMEHDAKLHDKATDELIHLVQRPGLPMDRVDLILQTLLESRRAEPRQDRLAIKLVQALRATSVDARSRVQDALIFLSTSCNAELHAPLREWKPVERDSSTTLEEKIRAWKDYWSSDCHLTERPA
jgi:hypothetical protein